MNKYKILADNNITITGNESKYQRRYKRRKNISNSFGKKRVLTIPELKALGEWK